MVAAMRSAPMALDQSGKAVCTIFIGFDRGKIHRRVYLCNNQLEIKK